MISYLKYDPSAITHVRRGIGYGVSQTGRFVRHFLYQGFNTDENGRVAFDGFFVHTAGAGVIDPTPKLVHALGARALGAYLRGGSGLVDVAMHDVVAASTGRSWSVPAAAGQDGGSSVACRSQNGSTVRG